MKKENLSICYFMVVQVAVLALWVSGCATQGKSVGLGAALGAGTGAVLGGIADPGKDGEYRTRNVIVGAAIGGVAGTIGGAVLHDETQRQKQDAFERGRTSAPAPKSGNMPALKNPKVEARWVEGRVLGNRYVEGHFEYLITEPARWEDN